MNCKNCAGPLPDIGYKCEYCGSKFREKPAKPGLIYNYVPSNPLMNAAQAQQLALQQQQMYYDFQMQQLARSYSIFDVLLGKPAK